MYTVCKLSADSENGNNFIMFFLQSRGSSLLGKCLKIKLSSFDPYSLFLSSSVPGKTPHDFSPSR